MADSTFQTLVSLSSVCRPAGLTAISILTVQVGVRFARAAASHGTAVLRFLKVGGVSHSRKPGVPFAVSHDGFGIMFDQMASHQTLVSDLSRTRAASLNLLKFLLASALTG